VRAGVLTLVAVAGAAVLLPAQTPTTFRGGVHTVRVYATVRDRDGQLVRGLTRDDFELFENGRRRPISVFSSQLQPISVAILLDRSGSIGSQTPHVAAAASAFVSKLLDGDRASISSLTWNCQSFTADKPRLLEVLGGSLQADQGSPVWAGLDRTLSAISHESSRRVVLMLSDGADSGVAMHALPDPEVRIGDRWLRMPGICQRQSAISRATAADVARRAGREDVMVYAVGVQTAGPVKDNELRRIAQDSGGEFIWLTRGGDLTQTFTRIADELHQQYLIGFVPETFDGKPHRIEVRATRPRLTVRARRSFVADANAGATAAAAPASPSPIAPLPPVTAAEVDRAIADGLDGRRLQASCVANGMFPDKPAEGALAAEVIFEGPVGRIMRRAREAARDRTPFDATHVTDADRAPTLTVTAELKSAIAAEPFRTPAEPPPGSPAALPLSYIRLWSDGPNPSTIPAIAMSTGGGLMNQMLSRRLTLTFDLAAFKAMPGARVEAAVYSLSGSRSCHISARDKFGLR
jgi:Ca-activated chloride channel family protein